MTVWILEPRDPLLVRDGRPFGPDPGARATSLPFPFPSTIAGGIRARAGVDENGIFQYTRDNRDALERLKQLPVRGPLLVQLTDDGVSGQWLVPAPGDAQLFPSTVGKAKDNTALVQQIVPLQLPEGAQTDLSKQELLLVGQSAGGEPGKPLQNSPAYWYWNVFATWLLNPSELVGQEKSTSELGLRGLVREQRLHVSIEAERAVAKDGMLFETSGLEFTVAGPGEQRLTSTQRLALAVIADDNNYTIRPGLAGFAGERRIVTWRRSSMESPVCPDQLEATIRAEKRCRAFLLTPACFKQGYRPTWLQTEATRYGVIVDLKAIVLQRPQVVSGWDLAINKPRPSRRLAPAGTVLFLSLKGSDTAIGDWIRNTWMHCISDDPQDNTDGFGLAVLGTWPEQQVVL